jgi:Uri superfamily endonuclease
MVSSIIGTYVLALWLGTPQRISIGRLGEIEFPAGWYLYAGSAQGPGGLAARLARHQRLITRSGSPQDGARAAVKRAHWHIDYLREQAIWGGAWGRFSPERLECTWAAKLRSLPGAKMAAAGFGASDCRCPAHLVRVPALPDEKWVAKVLGAERIIVGNREFDELLHTLVTADEESREAAALALGRFSTRAIDSLAALLHSDDVDARWWSARTMAEIGGDGVVLPLVRTLSDPDPDVRACAALALGRIGAGVSAPALATRLADESTFVASIAADALTLIGEPAIEALAEMLTHESAHTRLLAVKALGRIKSESAIGPLFGVLEDPSYLVRYHAHEALEALGMGLVFIAP